MDFFNSLTLDLKLIVVGIAGCVLLSLFSANRTAEKRYVFVLVVLSAVGVYRFMHTTRDDQADRSIAQGPAPHVVKTPPKHVPLESTSAR